MVRRSSKAAESPVVTSRSVIPIQAWQDSNLQPQRMLSGEVLRG